jgi:hypothetical protein
VLALHSQPFCTLRVLQALTAPLVLQAHPPLVGPQLVTVLVEGEQQSVLVARFRLGPAVMVLAALFIWSGNL